ILTRNARARFTFVPDTLAKTPREPLFRPISTRTVIGSGDTRVELIPVRGETGERMMLAWLPGAKVLYSSDLIQRTGPGPRAGFFRPMMLAEVEAAVRRENLDGVDRGFGMPLTPTPWSSVVAAIDAARGSAAAVATDDPAGPLTAPRILRRAIDAMGGE